MYAPASCSLGMSILDASIPILVEMGAEAGRQRYSIPPLCSLLLDQ